MKNQRLFSNQKLSFCLMLFLLSTFWLQAATLLETNFDGADTVSSNGTSGTGATSITGVTWTQDSTISASSTISSLNYNLANDNTSSNAMWDGNIACTENLNSNPVTPRGLVATFTVSGTANIPLATITIGHGHSKNSGLTQDFASDMTVTITDTTDSAVVWTDTTNYGYSGVYFLSTEYSLATASALQPGHTYEISLSMKNLSTGGAYATWDNILLEGGIDAVPVANDDNFTAARTTQLTGDVVGNDEFEGQTLYTHVVGTAPDHLTFDTDGSFTYDTPSSTVESVTFTYELTDNITQGLGSQLDTAQVTIEKGTAIHYWKFENNLTDELGAINSAFNVGPGAYVAGHEGNALSLAGNDYVETDPIAFGLAGQGFSITGWINRLDTTNRAIFTYHNGATELMKLLTIENGTKLRVYGLLSGTKDTPAIDLALNTWQHFAVTIDGSDLKIYLDGTLVHSDLFSTAWTVSAPLNIGANAIGGQLFNGAMDNVRIYNYPLDQSEINLDLTPAIGLELVQERNVLSWSVEEEIGVKLYQVVNVATGEILETIVATGEASYATTVPAGVTAKLIVVDNSGFKQTFNPADGNIETVTYDLVEGWNLIAITGDNGDLSALGTTWGWNGSAYELVTNPQPTQAVWVYSANTVQVNVTAEKSDATIELASGWNMVGPVENCKVPETAHTVYGWNETYEQIVNENDTLIRGVGYWIFSL